MGVSVYILSVEHIVSRKHILKWIGAIYIYIEKHRHTILEGSLGDELDANSTPFHTLRRERDRN